MNASNKLTATLLAIWGYAAKVPGLVDFLKTNQETAIAIVKDLANVYKGKPFDEWKVFAIAGLQARGIDAEDHWQDFLINLGHEVWKGQQARPWYKRIFSRVSEFLVRNGLNTFIEGWIKDVVDVIEKELRASPAITFQLLYDTVFKTLKTALPDKPGTWLNLVINLGIAIATARLGIKLN